ncbi:MAG: glycerophosphodiester phosphodiesterase, partial [Anaerolineales bacterium]
TQIKYSTFSRLPSFAIIAHRGASAYAPENTIVAFELAVQQAADAIELDACLTRDEQIVVIHGPSVAPTTGVEKIVGDMTLKDIQTLDICSEYKTSSGSLRIPTLDEVFEVVGKRIVINVELKDFSFFSSTLPEKIATIVKQHNFEDWVFFSSFNPISLIKIKKDLPHTPIALLTRRSIYGSFANSLIRESINYQALHPYHGDLSTKLVKRLHKNHKRIHPFTLNSKEDIVQVIKIGVDGIIGDDPLLMRSVKDDVIDPQENHDPRTMDH